MIIIIIIIIIKILSTAKTYRASIMPNSEGRI